MSKHDDDHRKENFEIVVEEDQNGKLGEVKELSKQDECDAAEASKNIEQSQLEVDTGTDAEGEFIFVDSDTPDEPDSLEQLTESLLDDWHRRFQERKNRLESVKKTEGSDTAIKAAEGHELAEMAQEVATSQDVVEPSDVEDSTGKPSDGPDLDNSQEQVLNQEDSRLKFTIVGPDGRAVEEAAVKAEEKEKSGEEDNACNSSQTEAERRKQQRMSLLESQELVMLPIPDLVIFPNVILPLSIETDMAIHAVEYAIEHDLPIFLITKRKGDSVGTAKTTLYKTGCICAPVQAMRLSNGIFRMVLHGVTRARVRKITARKPFAKVFVEVVADTGLDNPDIEATVQVVTHQFRQAASLNSSFPPELVMAMSNVRNPGQIADIVAANLDISTREKQSILDVSDVSVRLHKVSRLLSREIEIMKIEQKIHNRAEMEMVRGHKEYFLRQQIKAIQEELGDAEDEDSALQHLREEIEAAGMSEEAAERARKELKRLRRIPTASPDYDNVYTYIERLLQFPWKTVTEDKLDLKQAAAILDEEHYGLKEVKERILDFLAVRKLKPDHHGPILCFVGPPGVGKTSLGRSIARTMGRKFNRTSLGGLRDEAEIRGHRSTYIGSMPGRIIQAMCTAGSRNPVIMLDEIDKLGNDYRGDPAAALLEALDPEQNSEFKDNYFGVPTDLSSVMFILTANVLDTIPPALRDRMEIIRLSGYTLNEKKAIANGFLIPRQREENGLNAQLFNLSDEALHCVIREYTREAGVRGLEREIAGLCRKTARQQAESKRPRRRLGALTVEDIHKFLGVPHYVDENEVDPEPVPGCVQGLAWTQVGGEMLTIEARVIPGRGRVTLTGSLGQVMKESAKAAITWARGYLSGKNVEFDYYKNDIHVHVPEGATPKDGPSAGITLACALVSAVTGIPARQDIAMTGEITLTGKVMAIGGVKEKVLAAFNISIKEIILPEDNRRHLEEIPEDIRQQIKFHFVKRAEQVIDLVLTEKLPS